MSFNQPVSFDQIRIAFNLTGFSNWTPEWKSWMLEVQNICPDYLVLAFEQDLETQELNHIRNLKSITRTDEALNWLKTSVDVLFNLTPVFEPSVSPIATVGLLPITTPSQFWSVDMDNSLGLTGMALKEFALRQNVVVSNSTDFLDLLRNTVRQKAGKFISHNFQQIKPEDLLRWAQQAAQDFQHNEIPAQPPLVSIVTPSFNQGHFLERTLNSVFRQGYPNIEYQVVDGGSTDNSIQVLNQSQGKIRWVSEKDSGYPEAVNKGFQKCTGKYLMWLPSDDMLYSDNSISQLVNAAEEQNADVVFGDAFYIDQNDRLMGHYRTECYTPERLREWCLICQPATLFKADLFKKIGGLDQSFRCISDYDLWLRMSEAGAKFVRIGAPISCYRIHGDSLTVKQKNISYREIFDLQLRRYKTVRRPWVLGAFKEVVLQQNLPAIWKSTNTNGVARTILRSSFAKRLIRGSIETYLANNIYFQRFIRRRIEPRESIWGRGR